MSKPPRVSGGLGIQYEGGKGKDITGSIATVV